MELNTIIAFLACISFIFIFGKLFTVPIRIILKFILNSLLGGVLIFIINLIGGVFGFHIGLNIINALIIGILGIPGVALLILLKILIV